MMDLLRETENLALGQASLYPVTIYHHGILLGFMKPTARDFMGSGSVLQQVLSRAEGTGDFCLASHQNPSGACSDSFLSPGPACLKPQVYDGSWETRAYGTCSLLLKPLDWTR